MRRLFFCLVALMGLVCTPVFAQHPRLLVNAADLPALQAKVLQEPWAAMAGKLEEVADSGADFSTGYNEAEYAYNCAFLYAITGDDSWAAKARAFVESRIYDTTDMSWAGNIKGLNLYWVGAKVALAYDFCYSAPSWDEPGADADAFRKTVSQKLYQMGEKIWLNGGTEQNTNPASNWQGIRGAAGGICLLATDEPVDPSWLEGCFGKVSTYLNTNMSSELDARGWNIEAIGYTMYPWGFVGPFGIAAANNGLGNIRDAAPHAVDFALWTVYAATARMEHLWPGYYGIHPDFSDDNNVHRGEGSYGLAFYYCPEVLHPGLSYWYDRLVGFQGDQSFDRERSGVIYSILYHPGAAVTPVDPMTIAEWRNAFLETGGNGYFTYRDRYQDADDMIAQVYAKFRGNAGHNGADALNFRILGLDTCFVTGGGRYGPKTVSLDNPSHSMDAFHRSQNGPYPVNPDHQFSTNGNSGYLIGAPQLFDEGGGTVVLAAAANNVGAQQHTRRFLADYSEASGAEAVFVVSDTTDNGYFWQLCTPEFNTIALGPNEILITAPNGASMKATILYPEVAQGLTSGTRIRGSDYGYKGVAYDENDFAHFQSADGDYLVVMTVVRSGESHPPVSSLSGSGANQSRVLEIGGLTVHVDGDSIGRGAVTNALPVVTITTPLEGTPFAPAPAMVTLSGTVSDPDGPIQKVEVYSGYDLLGEATLGAGASWQASIQLPDLGQYPLQVKAYDQQGAFTWSDVRTVSVHTTLPPLLSVPFPIHNSLLTSGSFDLKVDAWDRDGSVAGVDVFHRGTLLGSISQFPASLPVSGLAAGSHSLTLVATDNSGEVTSLERTFLIIHDEVPLPWMNFDVGEVQARGYASLNGDDFSITGSGNDIWNNQSEFHFVSQALTGDGEIVAYFETQTNTDRWAKAGLMIRDKLSAGSVGANICVTPSNGVAFQYRSNENGVMASSRHTGFAVPVWLRLVRSGNLIEGYRSVDGNQWVLVGSRSLSLGETVFIGLCITSHNDGTLSTATGSFGIPGGIQFANAVETLSFSAFQDKFFTAAELSDPLVCGPDADPDRDGLSNLQEYLQGSDPRQASSARRPKLEMQAGSSRLLPVFSLVRAANHPEGTLEVLVRRDFSESPTVLGFPAVQQAPLGNGLIQRIAYPPEGWETEPSVFFQLQMDLTP